jgi:hypothetical protein
MAPDARCEINRANHGSKYLKKKTTAQSKLDIELDPKIPVVGSHHRYIRSQPPQPIEHQKTIENNRLLPLREWVRKESKIDEE